LTPPTPTLFPYTTLFRSVAPALLDPARHVRRVLPSRPRPDLVEPDREPAAAPGRRADAERRARARLGARRGLHRAAPNQPGLKPRANSLGGHNRFQYRAW